MRSADSGLALLAAAAVATSGCQVVSGLTELEIEEGPPDRWACLEQASAATPEGPLEYEASLRRLTTNALLTDVTVKVCENADDPCSSPLQTLTPSDGLLSFTIDAAFDGYLELESETMMPAVIELTRPIGAMRELPEPNLVDLTALETFAGMMDLEIDPTLGHALYWAEDCEGERADGVSVEVVGEVGPSTARYYVVDRLPSDSVDRTDAFGAGGFINLPTTFVVFDARRADTGAHISRFSARIRPGWVTYVVVEPD